MSGQYDVILTGGGVMGCAAAYYLLQADNRLRVAIIERDPTYERASTPLSDGNIRIQFNIKENIQISQYGLQVLDRFAEEMAVGEIVPDAAFRRQGNLFLFNESGKEAAELGLALQRELGCDVELLVPAEINKRFPLIDAGSLAGGTFGRNEGTMDPHAFLQAYKNKAISLGAAYLKEEAASLNVSDGAVQGVTLKSGTVIKAPVVVNSAGAWINKLAETAGFQLPVTPVKRQVFVLETASEPGQIYPLIVFPSGLYLIQEHGGQFLCGKSLEDDPITDSDFSWSHQHFEEQLWPELVDYLPSFDRLKLVSGWAGLYAVNTFDGNAILGPWPGLEGLHLMGGFSGHGLQQAPAAGRYIAELILGRSLSLDLSIFSPLRILENRPAFENPSRLV